LAAKNTTRNFLQKNLGIYNGVDAAAGDFPFAVMLKNEKTDSTESRCAGVLFAYNLVITESKLNIIIDDQRSYSIIKILPKISNHFNF
jgi:hypothetical protein